MSVSVLVPAYNHAPFIEKTLRSIYKQTLPPKKLIVIDDGSKDESTRIIERSLKECPFPAEFIARENRGLCNTLNEGFALCDSVYFAYISSDDLWLSGFLESRVKMLESRPDACLSYGHAFLIDEKEAIIDNTESWSAYTDGKALEMLLYPIIPTSAAVVYRSSILKDYLWNPEAALEDYELYLRLAAKYEFALDKSGLSAWRIHGSNTSADFPRMINEWLESQRRVAAEIGLSGEQLGEIQQKLKFRSVKDLIRRGFKEEAWKLFRENLEGAGSIQSKLKTGFRFIVPHQVGEIWKSLKRKRTSGTFGDLEMLARK